MKVYKRIKSAVCLLAVTALLLCVLPPEEVKADNEKITALEQKIREAKEEKEKTQNEINENKEELNSLNDTATSLRGTLNALNSELGEVSEHLEKIEGQISEKNAEIVEIEEKLAEALAVEDAQYEAMKIRIRYMYEKQDYAVLDSLFGASSFADFLNRNSYIESVTTYDRKLLAEYRHTREVIEEAQEVLNGEKEALDALHHEAADEQDRVSGLVSYTVNSISAYQNEIEATEQEIAAYEEELDKQNANIAALQAELAEERRLSELAARSAWRDISEVSFAEGDRYLLANLIYCEAGNQPYEGQVAVGAVVINRVLSSVFPDSVVGVIYQNKQFSPVRSGRLAYALANNSASSSCYSAADAAMSGQTTVGNCLFFRTPIEGLSGIQVGGHIFY